MSAILLQGELFNHSVAVSLSSCAEIPSWLYTSDLGFHRKIASVASDILGSGVDLPILVPTTHLDSTRDWTAVILRKLFREWMDGSGASVSSILLNDNSIAMAGNIHPYRFAPAAPADVIVGAIQRQCPRMRHIWLNSLLDNTSRPFRHAFMDTSREDGVHPVYPAMTASHAGRTPVQEAAP